MRREEDLIDGVIDAWNRRDREAVLALAHPEIEYVNAPDAVEPGVRHGHDGLAIILASQWELLGDARQEVVAVHVRGDRRVTEARVTRSMPGSATPLENRVAMRWTFREGLVARIEVLGAGSSFKSGLDAALT